MRRSTRRRGELNLVQRMYRIVFLHMEARRDNPCWKLHGDDTDRLTNSRSADDMLVYAKSLQELDEMLQHLQDEFAKVGLPMHESTTKIRSTFIGSDVNYVSIGDLMIEMLHPSTSLKYLGRPLSTSAGRE